MKYILFYFILKKNSLTTHININITFKKNFHNFSHTSLYPWKGNNFLALYILSPGYKGTAYIRTLVGIGLIREIILIRICHGASFNVSNVRILDLR